MEKEEEEEEEQENEEDEVEEEEEEEKEEEVEDHGKDVGLLQNFVVDVYEKERNRRNGEACYVQKKVQHGEREEKDSEDSSGWRMRTRRMLGGGRRTTLQKVAWEMAF